MFKINQRHLMTALVTIFLVWDLYFLYQQAMKLFIVMK